jgi:hypothetical protein
VSVRATALRWLATHHRVRDADIFTSRFYPAAESWTARDAWWVQIPVARIEALGTGAIHVVCEAEPGARGFHYLRLPAAFLREHLDALDRPGDGRVVSLFLSADPAAPFVDERGAGHLSLAPFVQPPAAG